MSDHPSIESRRKAVLTVDGCRFRDLNGDGELTPYEDWRLTPHRRAADLCSRLSVSQKAGLMIIGSQYMAGSPWVADDGGLPDLRSDPSMLARIPEPDDSGSFLRKDDGYARTQMMTGEPLSEPRLHASSARGAILERHQRRFIVRDNPAAGDLARWANELQELAEESEFGIPVVLASNPRNHVSDALTLGIGESVGVFSEWPGELGLTAIGDETVIERFAEIARQEWRAAGLHKMYGYMADVPSEPRWSRFSGTFGEDPEVIARVIARVVRGFQGESLGPGSIALTIKHFPGGGVRTDGHDPHFAWGQDNEYPTERSLETYQLPPFRAAIEAGVASVMPYYSKPVNTSAEQMPEGLRQGDDQFEEVAFAYNRAIISDLLRDRLGFTGYVNTDSGVLDGMAWGVGDLTTSERWAKLIRAGSDVVSDEVDPRTLLEAIDGGWLDESELDRSVSLLLEEMFALGLFENPYVNPEDAERIVGSDSAQSAANAAQRASVTLLRNDRDVLPLTGNERVYVEAFSRHGADAATAALRNALVAECGVSAVTTDPAKAQRAILWVLPSISLFGGDDRPDSPISVELSERGIDTDRIRHLQSRIPTVLVVNTTNPWIIADIEPTADAVLATYGITADNLARVLSDRLAPTGHLPLTLPRDAHAVASSPRDVPGMFCGKEYAYVDRAGSVYSYGFSAGEDGSW